MGNQEYDDLEVGECLGPAVDEAVLPATHAASYGSQDVVRAVGINLETLQHWLARDVDGALKLAQQNPGRGKPRSFTFYEVSRLCFAKKLLDLNLPLVTAFKITDAMKTLWEKHPMGMEANPYTNWLFVVRAEQWLSLKPFGRFPLNASPQRAGDFFAIWAVENKPVSAALNFFGGSAVLSVNLTALLAETQSILAKVLSGRPR